MLKLSENVKVYLCVEPYDMRKSINGLTAVIGDVFHQLPQSESLFIFSNRGKDKVKCIFWDKNGFVLYYKRMERGKFCFSKELKQLGNIELTQTQLEWLLAGLDFITMGKFPELNYRHYY